jgi:hypothetical protein
VHSELRVAVGVDGDSSETQRKMTECRWKPVPDDW